MNLKLLKAAETKFMTEYPGGFENEEMQAMGKKHKLDKMKDLVHDVFAEEKFMFTDQIIEDMIKVVSRASIVSMFEKPKFRDYLRSLDQEQKEILAMGLKEQLYGDKEKGFNMVLDVLVDGKLAKWSLMTVIPVYFAPEEEIFVKPSTTKQVVKAFELEDIVYKPRPSYDFYVKYKAYIEEMKAKVNPLLSPNNPAFTGFLMIVLK